MFSRRSARCLKLVQIITWEEATGKAPGRKMKETVQAEAALEEWHPQMLPDWPLQGET